MEKVYTEQSNINIDQNEIEELLKKYSSSLGEIILQENFLVQKSDYDLYNIFNKK